MIQEQFLNQTAQTLSLGNKLVAGRRYILAVVGTAVAYSLQYNTPGGAKSIQGLTALTPTDANTILTTEFVLAMPNLTIQFAADPVGYHVYLQEIKTEVH